MVVDTLKNYKPYCALNQRFSAAFAFIEKAIEEDLAVGKYFIEGNDLYASIQQYTTKAAQDGALEGHEKYIDIQVVLSGKELIKVTDIANVTPKTDYNSEKDVQFYEDCGKESDIVLNAGQYAILFANDIHKPGLTYGETACDVKKLVVKVKI